MKKFWTIIAFILVILYVASPLDIIPDIFPVVGLIDDIIVVGLFIYYIRYGRFPHFLTRFFRMVFYAAPKSGGGYAGTGTEGQRADQQETQGGYRKKDKDPHAVLGVRRGASRAEIQAAYRHAAQQYHPDKVSHLGKEFQDLANRKFAEIKEAYDALMGKSG
jgi:hypothetical protein